MLDPPSSGTPFIILPGNSWHFMTRHILSMSFDVASPYVLKSHESFTYVSPDVFSVSHKSLIVNILQEIVRVSFSAPNASQKCGAFLFVAGCRSMRLGQLAPVSSFRPGLHTAAVYTNPFLETFFFVHIGSVQIQAPSVGTTITNRRKTI
jgi:hypothetical protein